MGLFIFDPYMDFASKHLNFKPFNCVLCMTFWLTSVAFFFTGFPVLYSIISAVIAEFTYRKIVNYNDGE